MKRLTLVLLILVFALTSCVQQNIDSSSQNRGLEIESLIDTKVKLVKAVNLEDYLQTLDPGDLELQTEQSNWMTDIKQNPIGDYSLVLLNLEQINENTYRAKLRQQYKRDGKDYKLDYYNEYKVIDGKIYDGGNYFQELKKGNITIKYTAANKKLAEEVIDDMNQLYDENIKRWGVTPKRPLVIKMFADIEELRQSIKLSMWQCSGWYEYGESVKMLVNRTSASKDRIKMVVNHEMTHLFTVEKSSGNLAYWLSEGIATYYEVPETQKSPKLLYRSKNINLLTIDEIEAIELEKLEDRQKISDYYSNAHLITAFIVERYGEDKILEVLEELGKMTSRGGATSENDVYYRKYLSQVLPRVLGHKDYETFKTEWKNEMNKL